MPQVINTNIASLNAQRNLNASQGQANTALERLSSGLRINSAKDDAAGLAISERFQSQISGLNQAQRNANDGISLAQTAEGAMDEITNNLQRIRELAVQSANATNSISDRQALNQEVQQRVEEINRIASQTSFNGLKVLDGTFGVQTFQVGANTGETIGISGLDSRGSQLGAVVGQTENFVAAAQPVRTSSEKLELTSPASPMTGDITVDGVPLAINNDAADVVGLANTIQIRIDADPGLTAKGITVKGDNDTGKLTFANPSGEDVPVAINLTDTETPAKTFVQNLTATGGGLDAYFKAGNTGEFNLEVNGVAFSVEDTGSLNDLVGAINARSNDTGVKANLDKSNNELMFPSAFGGDFTIKMTADLNGDNTNNIDFDETYTVAANTVSLNDTDISTSEGADRAMIAIDYAIDQINGFRAELGAVQNRFESTIANLATTSENLSASNSRIRDADFAAESAELARTQVLQQAGLSVLAQANARPQQVLQLLQG
ncbi:flagellin [Marinobacter sp.]|uniref:flagellin n=1 Tax=Marinobacter sp. TaxID=50741 RepID=UPI003F99D051